MTIPLFIACCLAVVSGVTAETSDVEYAVVIDAGSTGSRVRVYNWHEQPMYWTKLPRFNMTTNYKANPGISSFAKNFDGLSRHIGDLVAHAKRNVPETQTAETPIYLMATAGMRLLLEAEADAVMAKIHLLLSDKSLNPFKFRRIQSRVLSGEEEGVFGWLAVNYLNNLFQIEGGPFGEGTSRSSRTGKHEEEHPDSWGIVELGGASLQIAFIPAGSLLANKFPVKVLGTYYPLYVHSYLGYGQQQILRKITDHLLASASGSAAGSAKVINNPCMLKDDIKTHTVNDIAIEFRGTGNPAACRVIFRSILTEGDCSPKPCGLGHVYQPTIPSDKMFFELSAFAHTIKAIGILDDRSPTHTLSRIIDATSRYCNKTVDSVKRETGRNGDFLSVDCTIGVYMEVLFKDVYRFKATAKFSSGFKINGGEPEWPLGAVIYEHERREQPCIFPKVKIGASESSADTTRFTAVIVICTVLLGVLCATH
ncbi:Ectonucleoside triphosphate diphosphohydrolase 1 [Lamellibrachia satsuma]|nr:Ectonucleoside triphosphate diphosphohydrolase 1 [Lamellibrachia satsuma]